MSSQAFQKLVSEFSYISPTSSPALRRSPRKHVPSKPYERMGDSLSPLSKSSPRGRRQNIDKQEEDLKSSTSTLDQIDSKLLNTTPKKKIKRSYASPEKYGHLGPLSDHIAIGLDIMFCGINPGYKSAEVGHHFANPTNHFWRCLHQSGLTSMQLSPTEDHSLPQSFGLGLTNLITRPSKEQAELSRKEMKLAVPDFLQKVSHYRPRIVCFVGMGIWEITEEVISGMKTKCKVGLQRYKLVYPVGKGSDVAETLLYAVPSTSGLVVQYQLVDKVKIFHALNDCSERVKTGKLDTSQLLTIPMNQL